MGLKEYDAIAQNYLGVMFRDGDGIDSSEFDKELEQLRNRPDTLAYEKGLANCKEKEAAKWFRKAAEQGVADAQCNLGVMYVNGEGVDKDAKEALTWFRKAAEQGDAGAQRNLGIMYVNGNGVDKDAKEARTWFGKAAEQGEFSAQRNLGVMYYNGYGVDKDMEEAAKWFKKSVESLSRTANEGDADSQLALGKMYANGEGLDKDEKEAAKWYLKAAEQGVPDAQFNIGCIYADGLGVAKDAAEGAKWLRQAAKKGDPDAQCALAALLHNGDGVAKDDAEALDLLCKAAERKAANVYFDFSSEYAGCLMKSAVETLMRAKWFRKVAGLESSDTKDVGNVNISDDGLDALRESGVAEVQIGLGIMYYNGKGVRENEAEAAKWFLKAAKQGNAHAQFYLGVMCRQHLGDAGGDNNEIEAAKWFLKAAEQGNARAQNNLGAMYAKREVPASAIDSTQNDATDADSKDIFEKNGTEAIKWFRKAAEQGNANAQNNLGSMYANGYGVAKNDSEAAKWLRKAAEQGDESAQRNFGSLASHRD